MRIRSCPIGCIEMFILVKIVNKPLFFTSIKIEQLLRILIETGCINIIVVDKNQDYSIKNRICNKRSHQAFANSSNEYLRKNTNFDIDKKPLDK